MRKLRLVESTDESIPYESSDERRLEDKALREVVPREHHGHWKSARNRRDPVDILNESDKAGYGSSIRFGRMMPSPFAFYRGSAAVMAADPAAMESPGIRVQACGDAAMIAGYIGLSEIFDDAMCGFAVEYADRAQSNHRALVKAVRHGRITAVMNA